MRFWMQMMAAFLLWAGFESVAIAGHVDPPLDYLSQKSAQTLVDCAYDPEVWEQTLEILESAAPDLAEMCEQAHRSWHRNYEIAMSSSSERQQRQANEGAQVTLSQIASVAGLVLGSTSRVDRSDPYVRYHDFKNDNDLGTSGALVANVSPQKMHFLDINRDTPYVGISIPFQKKSKAGPIGVVTREELVSHYRHQDVQGLVICETAGLLTVDLLYKEALIPGDSHDDKYPSAVKTLLSISIYGYVRSELNGKIASLGAFPPIQFREDHKGVARNDFCQVRLF